MLRNVLPNGTLIRTTRLGAAAVLASLGLFLGGCEPCDGLAACTEHARFAVSGRVVDPVHGLPVPGTRVDLVRTGGEAAASDSVSSVVDASGTFAVSVDAAGLGTAKFDLVLSPPNGTPYRVPLTVRASDIHGEAKVLGTFVTQPVFPYSGELFYRGNKDQLVPDVPTTFRRTGGVQLFGPGWQGDQYNETVNGGRIRLFSDLVFPVGFGHVTGDLTVQLPAPYGPTVAHLDLTPTYVFRPPGGLLRIGVGPNLIPYVKFFDQTTHKPVPGVQVHFVQTSGVAMATPDVTATSDGYGAVIFDLHPRATGPVVGDMTVTPPAPYAAFVMRSIQLTTMDSDDAYSLPDIELGPQPPSPSAAISPQRAPRLP